MSSNQKITEQRPQLKFDFTYYVAQLIWELNLPPIIWNVSHLKIFPLELLGPAIGLSAGPSSCKGKILRWDTTTNSPTTNKCLILDVVGWYCSEFKKITLTSLHQCPIFVNTYFLPQWIATKIWSSNKKTEALVS